MSDRYYGAETMSGAICAGLLAADRVRHAMSLEQWREVYERTQALSQRCSLAAIRRDAAVGRDEAPRHAGGSAVRT